MGASVWDSFYGQHEAHWLAYLRFFDDICKLGITERLEGLVELAESAGWVLPYEHICWVSERPNVLTLDTRERLHCGNGPALSYPDGWSIYAWHGIRVPERVIRGSYSIQDIFKEPNMEVRRAMIERMGSTAFFHAADAKLVHQDEDGYGHPRRLMRIPMEGTQRGFLQAVEVVCPTTGRIYCLGVPSQVKTCQEAVASTFGLKAHEYNPIRES